MVAPCNHCGRDEDLDRDHLCPRCSDNFDAQMKRLEQTEFPQPQTEDKR